MPVLDPIGASALMGVDASRKDQILEPVAMKCDGCGCTTYMSQRFVEPAKRQAAAMGHRFYIACRACAAPFLDEIATGNGAVQASSRRVLRDVEDDICERRRRFIEGN